MGRLSLVLVCALLAAAARPAPGEISWLRGFEEGRKLAFEQRKLIVLYFEDSANNQSFKMDHDAWKAPGVAALAGGFVCVRVDNTELSLGRNMILRDKAQKLILRYRITYTPTIVIIDPAGNEILRSVGYLAGKDLTAMLRGLPTDTGDLSGVLERLEQETGNIPLKIRAGDLYRAFKMPSLSNKYYHEAAGSDTLRLNRRLAEHVAVSEALNYYDLKELKRTVSALEAILDTYPASPQRPFHLYLLVKTHRELLNDVAAKDCLIQLEKEFPESEYTALARSLFQ